MEQKLSPTTKDVSSLYAMHKNGQLILRPDYQRESVWPGVAKAYLIDTILAGKPIPMIFLDKSIESGTNRMVYRVIDGQQRLRAVFSFIENRFRTQSSSITDIDKKTFKRLPIGWQQRILSYDFVVMELFGFKEHDLRDIFKRMNRYVVKLNMQELRQASAETPFSKLVDELADCAEWRDLKLFSRRSILRAQDKEFLAELAILYWEGPQDKKGSVDSYYSATSDQLASKEELVAAFTKNLAFIASSLPQLKSTIFAKRPGFYALMGALYEILADYKDDNVPIMSDTVIGTKLLAFSKLIQDARSDRSLQVEPYVRLFIESTSRQTDNYTPRTNSIAVLRGVIASGIQK